MSKVMLRHGGPVHPGKEHREDDHPVMKGRLPSEVSNRAHRAAAHGQLNQLLHRVIIA